MPGAARAGFVMRLARSHTIGRTARPNDRALAVRPPVARAFPAYF